MKEKTCKRKPKKAMASTMKKMMKKAKKKPMMKLAEMYGR